MPREYDGASLKKVQYYELSILKDFIQVCKDNGLSYFGLAGTGIGALRHKGFIPWDDDIDIGLLREDYEKALEVFKTKYSHKYTVVNGDEFNNYPLMTTRIILNGTKFIEYPLKNIKCPLGIFLDVYAFDNVAPTEKGYKKQAFEAWFYSKLLILKHIPFPVLPFSGVKAKIIHCITACAYAFLNVFCISHKFLYNRAKKASCRYNSQPADAYAYFCDTDRFSNYFKKSELFPLKKLQFEDIEICFPNGLEKSLEALYGDYMQLPPEDKRKNHYPFALEFPKEEGENLNG